MAIEAQYMSNFSPPYWNRLPSANMNSEVPLPFVDFDQDDLEQAYSLGVLPEWNQFVPRKRARVVNPEAVDEELSGYCRFSCSSGASASSSSSCHNLIDYASTEVQSHLLRHQQDIEHLILIQEEQTRQVLEAKRQRHTKIILEAIENRVNDLLREKDVEVQRLAQRNAELEKQTHQLMAELHLWQNVTRSHDIMISKLRENLAQTKEEEEKEAVAAAAEEGYGENDDAESCHINPARENKTRCRVCQANEVSILLMPCRHLCICQDCEGHVDFCPICSSAKNASVQVYLL